jgi:ABC-type thiamine transport system ATPase subunit
LTEQNVQLNPGLAGARVRTLEITTQETDGSLQTVEMQVVSIANPQGVVLLAEDFSALDVQLRILKMLRRVAGALEQGMELGVNLANESETEDTEEDT